MEISIQLLCICVIALFLACFIQRISGFGLGITVIAILPYFVGSHAEVAAMSGVLGSIIFCYLMIKLRKDVQWKTLIPCVIGNAILTSLCVGVSETMNFTLLEKLLGGVLILLSFYVIFLVSCILKLNT